MRINNTTESADWDAGDVVGTIEYYTSDASGNAPYVASFIKSVNETGNGTLPSGALTFGTATYNASGGAVERLRIDSSGNLLVGVTSTTLAGDSITLPNSGIIGFHDAGGNARNVLQFVSGTIKHGAAGAGVDTQTFHTNSQERMRISSTGAVSITADASNEQLTIKRASNTNEQLIFGFHSSDYGWIQSVEQGVAYRPLILNRDGGNVGIGTTTIRQKVHQHVTDSGANYHAFTNSTTGTGAADGLVVGISADEDALIWNHENKNILFGTNNQERMRLNNAGALLIGKTSENAAVAGTILNDTGDTYITAEGSQGRVLYLNRLTSDGDIIDLRKAGTAVGSIGVAANDNLYIAGSTGSTKGIYFNDSAIVPAASGGSPSHNAVDISTNAIRFRNLYLSGDIIAAGDVSTNELVVDTIATIDGAVSCGGITIVENNDAVMRSADNIGEVGSGICITSC